MGKGKAHLQGLKETGPRGDLVVAHRPLIPHEGQPIHVKRGYRQVFQVRRCVILEKLGDLEDPPHKIGTIKLWHLQLHTMRHRGL